MGVGAGSDLARQKPAAALLVSLHLGLGLEARAAWLGAGPAQSRPWIAAVSRAGSTATAKAGAGV